MERDWTLIKAILASLEEKRADEVLRPDDIEGYSRDTVCYHLLLLDEAGLIKAVCQKERSGAIPFCVGCRLTWEGHELLDAMRSSNLWHRLKDRLSDAGINISFTAIKAVIAEVIKEVI